MAATNSHDLFNTHQESQENNAKIPFDFTDKNLEIANEIISRYPVNYKRSAVIPLLDLAQKQNGGWIHLGVMNKIAEILEMPEIRVYEVATFYTMFNRSKIGKYHILVSFEKIKEGGGKMSDIGLWYHTLYVARLTRYR